MYIHSPFTLPDIEFVGGATQELAFRCYHKNNGEPSEMSPYSANFSVINAVNKHGTPLLSKVMTVLQGSAEDNGVSNVLYVVLTPLDTYDLWGKYIYQVTIKDPTGVTEIPGQGLLHITHNINESFVS